MHLPKFQRNPRQRRWVLRERRTAKLIRTLWESAEWEQRRRPAFLRLLVQLAWVTGRKLAIAKYLNAGPGTTDERLAQILHSDILKEPTGITNYLGWYRTATLEFVDTHAEEIALAFNLVSAKSEDIELKVRRVAKLLEKLGKIQSRDRSVSPFNGLTPALSCLDPQQRFPIINHRIRGLLKYFGREPNEEGVVEIYKLIGPTCDIGIRDARELDVYANTVKLPKPPKRRVALPNSAKSGSELGDLGFKSEINGFAHIVEGKRTITKLHNKLTNDLNDYLLWRHKTAIESRFDALVLDWKKGHDLLIEAKTASDGTTGRTQIRQAIGQLYDYRFTHLPKQNVDLAILLPKEPSADTKKFLKSLGIELLWFRGKQLTGTIHL